MTEQNRCFWVTNDPIYIKYHDQEWGRPVHDDRLLFEFLILEGMQAGLSWLTVLKKRAAFREAFDVFDIDKVAQYDEQKIDTLLENPGIIRNRLKIKSAIQNARGFWAIQKEYGSFDKYIWGYAGQEQAAGKISQDLKKRGFNFVGPTIIYAYLQAIGLRNDHEPNCYLYRKDN